MSNVLIKIRYIFLRHILISVVSVFLYTYLTYLNSKHGFLDIKSELTQYFFPVLLAIIVIAIWLRKPVLILNLYETDRGFFFYYMIAIISIVAPAIVAQNYLKSNFEELKEIQSFNEVDKSNYYNCYEIDDVFFNKSKSAVYKNTRNIGGKGSSNKHFNIYFVVPILDSLDDTSSNHYWLGVKGFKSIDNYQSKSTKEKIYEEFYSESVKKFNEIEKSDIRYLKVLAPSEDKTGFINAIKKQDILVKEDEIVILESIDELKSKDKSKYFSWIFGSFGIGSLIFFISLLIPQIEPDALERYRGKRPMERDDLLELFQSLYPRGEHFSTSIFAILTILSFIVNYLMGMHFFSPTAEEVLMVGALNGNLVQNGEIWRMFTSLFVSGGIYGLIYYLPAIAASCSFVEQRIGRWTTFLMFLVFGLIANYCSISFNNIYEINAGAMGPIFGMLGVLLALVLTKNAGENKSEYVACVSIFGAIGLIFGLLGSFDLVAQLAGLFSGFVFGVIFIYIKRKGHNFS